MYRGLFKGKTIVEARRHPRLPLKLDLKYRVLIRGKTVQFESSRSLAQDLGAKGVALRSRRDLKEGQLLTMMLYLPPDRRRKPGGETVANPETECQKVNILARVAWSKKTDKGEYLIGAEFLDIDPEHRKILKKFLVDYQLDDIHSVLYT